MEKIELAAGTEEDIGTSLIYFRETRLHLLINLHGRELVKKPLEMAQMATYDTISIILTHLLCNSFASTLILHIGPSLARRWIISGSPITFYLKVLSKTTACWTWVLVYALQRYPISSYVCVFPWKVKQIII